MCKSLRIGMLLLIALLLGMAPALANEADAVEFAAVEDKAVQLKDDFAVKAILARKNARTPLESSFQFYADGSDTYFSLAIRWMRASRLDFYLEKYVDGQYIGSLIAEEVKEAATADDAAQRVKALMESGLSRKDAIKQTAKELDLPKNVVYDAALSE